MAKLDRLGWADGLALTWCGERIGVRVSNRSAMEAIGQALPPGWKPAASPIVRGLYSLIVGGAPDRPGVKRFNIVYRGAYRIARSQDLSDALSVLDRDIDLWLATMVRRRVFLSAGVVGWKGRAVVLLGSPGSGRTALLRELLAEGAAFYSDRWAVLNAAGRAHPYSKPITSPWAGNSAMDVEAAPPTGARGLNPLPVGAAVAERTAAPGRLGPA